MKIGVLADTHVPVSTDDLPQKVYDCLKGCDLIIHAGDIVEMKLLEKLGRIAETKAVCGNMDSPEVKKSLPNKLVLNVAGKKIGVIHGSGPGTKVINEVADAFSEKCDIIIFGHSHLTFNEKRGETLFFNPGSPTDKVFSVSRSFGIIEIEGNNIKAEIIKVDD